MLTYFINGNYQEGVELFNKALELEEADNIHEIHEKLGMLYLDIGAFENAEFHFEKGRELQPRSGGLGWAYHAQGKVKEFHQFFQQYIDTFSDMTNAAKYDLAAMNACMGNKEAAYKWLADFNKTGWRWGSIHFIKLDPLFDDLRKEEKFQTILNNAFAEKEKIKSELQDLGLLNQLKG